MRTSLLVVNGLVLLVGLTDLCFGQNPTTRKWAIRPFQAAYAKGSLDAQSNKGKNVALATNKASLAAKADVQTKGHFSAERTGNTQEVKAHSAKGKVATADQTKAKSNGMRSAEAGGKYHGNLKQTKSGNDQVANMDLNTGQKMDADMRGNKESFDANGSKGHKQNIDPSTQTKTEGAGVITRDGKKYNYKETKSASNSDTTAQLTNVGKTSNVKTYTCQGQKPGISNCVDQNGLKYGEVVAQKDGTVIVKKTVAKGVDVPIGKSKVVRTADGKSVATVNDGLFQCQAGNYKERDCMADQSKSTPRVKVEKPFKFVYNSQTQNGKKMFTWPDCFTYGGKITLPPGVDGNRLAMQFDCSILPAGKLKCVDAGSCNKDCYYCNLCNNTRKLNGLDNSWQQNLCNAKGGQTVDVAVTMCPPPEAFNFAQCSGFTKYDANYYKKKGDIQCRVIVWARPLSEPQKQQEYYDKVRTDVTGLWKKSQVVQYSIDNKNFINANNPTDFDLKEWYIHKNGGPDQMVGCIEGTTNYTMSGQKVNTRFLLEAGSLAAAPKSLFDTKQCPKVDAINQQEAVAESADAQAAASKKGGGGGFNWG